MRAPLFTDMLQTDELIKRGMVALLIALPQPAFDEAMEQIRHKHLEAMGYHFMDEQHPAAKETPEG